MRYDTATPIGSGGMGEVFKAWDPDLERFVALKVLHHVGPEMVQRLLREARIQAHVEHPGVCKVYDVGEEDGGPYIAMEYVEGPLLSQAAPSLTLEQKVLVMQRVADAVQAAHGAGLVHRDLKPANIILGDGDQGELRPYVLDFGLAREQEVAGLTATGQVLGTPGYLSPEQARGEVTTLDRRTDVFSLGVVLYELLAGSLPFPGDSAVEILVKLLQKEPRALRQLAPEVPADLETVVMKCLEKDRDRRYGSARELADDLGRFLAGESIEARPVGRLRRLGRLARRHRLLTAAIVVSLATVLAAGALMLHTRWTARRSALSAQRFGQEVERIQGELRRAYLSPLHDLRPEIAVVRERMQWIEGEMDRLGGPAHAIGHYAIGRGHLELGETEQARPHLEEAWNTGYDEPEVADALGLTFSRLYRQELERIGALRSQELREVRRQRADRELREPAVRFLSVAREQASHPEYVAASLEFFAGDAEGAIQELASAREQAPWFYEVDLLAGDIHADLYRETATSGQAEAAAESFERALAAFTAATEVGRSDPRGHEGLCVLWSEALRHQYHTGLSDLEAVRDAALESCRLASTANPDLPTPHRRMGRIQRYWADHLVEKGEEPSEPLEAARRHLERAQELDPEDPEAHVVLGVTYRVEAAWRSRQGEDPVPYFERALAGYERAVELDPDYASAHLSLAAAELYLGDHLRRNGGDPEPHFERALESGRRAAELEPKMVAGHVNLGIAYSQLAIYRRDRGEEAKALFEQGAAEFREAIALNPEYYTAHFNLGEMLVERAELARRQGEDPTPFVHEARPLLLQAAESWPDWPPSFFLLARADTQAARWQLSQDQDPSELLARGWQYAHRGLELGADATGLLISTELGIVDARWLLSQNEDAEAKLAQARGFLGRARDDQVELPGAEELQKEIAELENSR